MQCLLQANEEYPGLRSYQLVANNFGAEQLRKRRKACEAEYFISSA
jgi:hypothetical protein